MGTLVVSELDQTVHDDRDVLLTEGILEHPELVPLMLGLQWRSGLIELLVHKDVGVVSLVKDHVLHGLELEMRVRRSGERLQLVYQVRLVLLAKGYGGLGCQLGVLVSNLLDLGVELAYFV